MPFSKDNWRNAFALDSNGNVCLNFQTGSGAGTTNLKGLDYALEEVIDKATGKFRCVVN